MGRRKKIYGVEESRLIPRNILDAYVNTFTLNTIEALVLLRYAHELELQLFQTADLSARKATGNKVFFSRAKVINLTNICTVECKFCSFYRKPHQEGAFCLKIDDVLSSIQCVKNKINHVIIQAGVNPRLDLQFYINLIREIKNSFPDIWLTALSPAIIHYLAKRTKSIYAEILGKFRTLGLNSINGTSAAILNDKIRKKIAPSLIKTKEWVEIITNAHKMGFTSTATMLFGHAEDEQYLAEHMDIIREIQLETGGFTTFIPIPFLATNTKLLSENKVKKLNTFQNMSRVFAVSRLYMGSVIPHIQVDWLKIGIQNTLQTLERGITDLGPIYEDPHSVRDGNVNYSVIDVTKLDNSIKKMEKILCERPPTRLKVLEKVNALKNSTWSYF